MKEPLQEPLQKPLNEPSQPPLEPKELQPPQESLRLQLLSIKLLEVKRRVAVAIISPSPVST